MDPGVEATAGGLSMHLGPSTSASVNQTGHLHFGQILFAILKNTFLDNYTFFNLDKYIWKLEKWPSADSHSATIRRQLYVLLLQLLFFCFRPRHDKIMFKLRRCKTPNLPSKWLLALPKIAAVSLEGILTFGHKITASTHEVFFQDTISYHKSSYGHRRLITLFLFYISRIPAGTMLEFTSVSKCYISRPRYHGAIIAHCYQTKIVIGDGVMETKRRHSYMSVTRSHLVIKSSGLLFF